MQEPFDRNQSSGAGFVRNGITLLSGLDPVRRCERTADAVSVLDKTLYFCPSPLYGYGLARFLSRLETEAPNSAVLCIEADSELYELSLNNIGVNTFGKKLQITNICDAGALCTFVRETWGARAFKRIETIRFTGGWQLFSDLYDSLCEALRREIATDWGNALTLAMLGRLYIRNALRNISLLSRFLTIDKLSFGEAPVLVLGAGPSLDETLDILKTRFPEIHCPKSRPFRIICVDTCLGALKARNIQPDLVVILESQHWNLRDFTGCKGWEVPAAVDLSALPLSTQILSGEIFLFMTPWTELRIFGRLKKSGLLPPIIPPLGSVGLTATELARRLTRGKIILCGLDFSFTADKYHARGTPGHLSRLCTQTRFNGIANSGYDTGSFTTVSKSGNPVRSNPVMRNYCELFQREFSDDPRLVDIFGRGLPLGVKTLSPEDVLSLLDEEGIKISGMEFSKENLVPEKGEQPDSDRLFCFYNEEKNRLTELRDILTGETTAEQGRLFNLITECDYLWAQFPDYSGGRKPDITDISFLKRVRAEIDPMIKLLQRQIKPL
jgi:hypothetical protein